MKHLGDITKINGAEIEPVDVITFGSPCQDLSVAGKRAGMKHSGLGDDETTRSGLFMEAARIINEMREATDGVYPNYAVWENVPGAFSSNQGEDFRAVLEELCRVKEPSAVIPEPPNGKWKNSGCIVGNGWSLAWRVLDAQFWGVPQRRRRISLVMDFGGQSAPEILFVRKSLSRDTAESAKARKSVAGDIKDCFGIAGFGETGIGYWQHGIQTLRAEGENRPSRPSKVICEAYCLQGSMIGRADKNGPQGDGINTDAAFALNATDRHSVAYGICSYASNSMKSDNPHSGIYIADTARTLDLNGGNPACNQGGIAICEPEIARTLTARFDSSPCADRGQNIIAVYDARRNGDGQIAPTMTGDHQNRVTDYTAVLCSRQRSDEFTENSVASTQSARQYKDATDLVYEPECAGIDCRNLTESPELYPTMQSKDQGGWSLNYSHAVRVRYRVRRLTPLECERLQGYPEYWTVLPAIEDMTDATYEFWCQMLFEQAVREEKARLNAKTGIYEIWRFVKPETENEETPGYWENTEKPYKHKTKSQMIAWYNSMIDTDGARYKALGNSIALPPHKWVLKRIAAQFEREATLGSLFDGIGGFPLIWEQYNGKGSARWASEIEMFPVAVTLYRFKEAKL